MPNDSLKNQPRILAFDCSGEILCVALGIESRCEEIELRGNVHASKLIPSIDKLLGSHDTDVSKLSAIGVGLGPGSFTGLRIALATAKALCWSANIPLIGFSSLQAIAHQYDVEGEITVMQKSRKNRVYAAGFKKKKKIIETIVNEQDCEASQYFQNHPSLGLLVGSALSESRVKEDLEDAKPDHTIPMDTNRSLGQSMIDLCTRHFEEKYFLDLHQVHPNYARPNQEVVNRPQPKEKVV